MQDPLSQDKISLLFGFLKCVARQPMLVSNTSNSKSAPLDGVQKYLNLPTDAHF